MKREGWQQHGAARANRTKLLRAADGAAAAAAAAEAVEMGAGAVVGALATPTGAAGKCRRPRCGGCHDHHSHHHPVTKARDKAKGARKLRACDVALNHRLVSWRVVDSAGAWAAGTGIPDYKGASASAVLAYLAGGNSCHEEDGDGDGFGYGGGNAPEAAPPASGCGLSDLYDFVVGHHAAAAPPPRATDIEVAAADKDATTDEEEDGDCDGYGSGNTLEAAPPVSGSGLSDLYDFVVGHHATAAPPLRATDIEVAAADKGATTNEEEEDDEEEEPDHGAASGADDEEDDMGFCMVGITIALEFSDGEEEWIVVEEI